MDTRQGEMRRCALLALLALSALLLLPQALAQTMCPQGCQCDDDTLVVMCESASLDVVPITLNPSIQRLGMRYNRVRTVDAALQFYGELQYVDLAHNALVSIPMRAFEAQRKLLELHLDHNKISAVDNGTFHGLLSLTVLSLRGNFLMELGPGQFGALRHLEELNLGQNRIAAVHPRAFDGLAALRVLHLDDNQLRHVPSDALRPLTRLAELRVGLNAFSTLEDNAFHGLSTLAVLDLAGAGLSNVSEASLRGLDGLRTLNLADNKLAAVPTATLARLARLEELILGQNHFAVLAVAAFQGLTNLRKLDVSGAPFLETVEKGAFRDNANLESLTLASNKKLTALTDGALQGLSKLRHLSLRNNQLTHLSEDMVSWRDLRAAELAGNPLRCGCGLRWLPELLQRWRAAPTLCAAPLPLRGQPLDELDAERLGCARQLDGRQQALIAIGAGAAAVVVALIALVLFKCRHRIRAALKSYRWNKRAISRKEQEYHKTFSDPEDYMNSLQKPIPVTEL
ncbi:insulin-like growth factor-binding protein complex acid labile subunit [Frankliniella occidentalis]|uniref:Insulin-like growth factor-binding protein complex acid labile subunit n=1 Tax=Frankliniella occidentalis TaxID=133901 RepID=A0A9C6U0D8_FRAOC|nr:insulin-like growth factor-binding protein complex acid labile subunit [Frankliniella occidentalis]